MFYETTSADGTRSFASAVASVVRGGDLIVLAGEMGAGKTAFTQGLAKALGVTEQVTSPTFTLVRSYDTDRGGRRLTLHHLDVYRLDRLGEVADLAIEELIDPTSVTVIEWGDAISTELPDDRVEITLTFGDEPDDREISVELVGASWRRRAEALEAAVEAALASGARR